MGKMEYVEANVEIVEFIAVDIITTSDLWGGGSTGGDLGGLYELEDEIIY